MKQFKLRMRSPAKVKGQKETFYWRLFGLLQNNNIMTWYNVYRERLGGSKIVHDWVWGQIYLVEFYCLWLIFTSRPVYSREIEKSGSLHVAGMGNIALLMMAKLLSNTQNKADYTGIVNCTCSCYFGIFTIHYWAKNKILLTRENSPIILPNKLFSHVTNYRYTLVLVCLFLIIHVRWKYVLLNYNFCSYTSKVMIIVCFFWNIELPIFFFREGHIILWALLALTALNTPLDDTKK